MNKKEAENLIDISKKTGAKINFIPYNEHSAADFKRPGKNEIKKFLEYFLYSGIFYSVRDSKGSDIAAACGQLAGKI